MSVPSVKAAAPACNDCATQPATICPSDVLKGLTTLDAIENYLYGQGEVMFKGIDYQCGGFHITHQFAVKDDGSWRAFCFNGKPFWAPQKRDSVLLKTILNSANEALKARVLILDKPADGVNGVVIINPEAAQLEPGIKARVDKLVSYLNY
jgi:hypothetical protein